MFSGDRGLDSLLWLALGGGGRRLSQLAGRPTRLRNRRDGVFENQLIVRVCFQDQRKLVKALDAAQEFGAIHQVDRDLNFFPPREIEEAVLNVL